MFGDDNFEWPIQSIVAKAGLVGPVVKIKGGPFNPCIWF